MLSQLSYPTWSVTRGYEGFFPSLRKAGPVGRSRPLQVPKLSQALPRSALRSITLYDPPSGEQLRFISRRCYYGLV
jgi:hypothetical protein